MQDLADKRSGAKGSPLGAPLTIDLVPETCWVRSLRAELALEDSRRLERLVLDAARGWCELCGRRDPSALECDELWSFDERDRIQRLERVLAVCSACCEVRHIDLAARIGTADRAVRHLAAVNGWEEPVAVQYVADAHGRWERRSGYSWSVDLERLRDYGIDPPAVRGADTPMPRRGRPPDPGLTIRRIGEVE
jgi:hypothetical protein